MKKIVLALTALLVGSAVVPLIAQIAPVPPAGAAVPLRGPAELDQMLAPIALYPDPLVAIILPAAAFPSQIVIADRYLQQGKDVSFIDRQPFDPSVKGLARYPTVMNYMDQNLAWTTDLGQAFLNQQADVMNSIQRLRAQALALGNLQSTPQQTVIVQGGIIQIVPANPQVIYVPAYQPNVVYVERPPAPGAFLTFGLGIAIGAWLNHDMDWHHHDVIVWGPAHPRPPDWWYRRERPVTVVPNYRVWHPYGRGPVAVPERGDRGWERHEPATGLRAFPPVISRPAPAPAPRTAPRPAPAPATRAPTGAMIGVQSARETHEYSQRGQQSRENMPRPAPPGAPGGRGPERGGRR